MPDTPPPIHLRPLRVLNRARARGIHEIATLAGGRIRDSWRSSETLLFYVRSTAGPGAPTERSDLSFREATPADAAAYARDIGTDATATFRRRLAPDVRCFLIASGGRIVHSSWVTTSGAWTREIASFVVPPEGDAYLYESFTRDDQRGRGIYPFALISILQTLGREGIAELWIGAEASNTASLKALGKAGFVEAFRLPFARRAGRLTRGRSSGPRASAAADIIRAEAASRPGG